MATMMIMWNNQLANQTDQKKKDTVASNNSDHKAPDDNLVAKQHDSGIGSIQPFQLEMDSERKNGNNDGNNNGNVEGLVARVN